MLARRIEVGLVGFVVLGHIPTKGPGRGDDRDDVARVLLEIRGWLFMLVVFGGLVGLGYWALRWSYLR